MDPRERADAALARARARGAFVVTPEDAVSPMDAANTLQIPRSVVAAADRDPEPAESTMVISAGLARGQAPAQPMPVPPAQQPRPHQPAPQAPLPPAAQAPHPGPQPGSAPTPRPQLDEPPAPQALDGLVPTVHQPGTTRGSLSRRLEGQ